MTLPRVPPPPTSPSFLQFVFPTYPSLHFFASLVSLFPLTLRLLFFIPLAAIASKIPNPPNRWLSAIPL
uniref:Uncharacterized protein n=1 Tax=Salix viminalis TaxID=40686 RepID=A0A6N2M4K7_SALVM